ncbi:MAG: triose-phosphate isomerase [Bacteroidota bacterium]
MNRNIVAGNWKMNLRLQEGLDLAHILASELGPADFAQAQVILGAPYIHLPGVVEAVQGIAGLHVAAQNIHQEDRGAYTGEISAEMLQSLGCGYAIIGHSERRQYFGETNALLFTKVQKALEYGIKPIYCLGETLEERENGTTFSVVDRQLREGVFGLNAEQFGSVVIAYEPIWAIGTGKTATPEQAQEVHKFLRGQVAQHFGDDAATQVTLLYGGSVKPKNAPELFACPDIDGGLVGGASLKVEDFLAIIRSF